MLGLTRFSTPRLKKSRSAHSNIRDALDCLLPFMTAYTRSIPGKQVLPQDLQVFLRNNFGFEIPIYALESTFKDLASAGHLQYHSRLRTYTAVSKDDTFRIAKEAIETDFDEIENLLSIHASTIGYSDTPPSGDWGRALINFLKPDQPLTIRTTARVKDALLDSRDLERRVVASLLQKLWADQPARFEKVVRIFLGALIEDFISGISELGVISNSDPLVVFYDTAVLLRSLGCSGTLHRTATSELTRYLQDIGCHIHYLAGNEAEVNNIFSALINVKDSGYELEGETADAISKGEISITDLRILQNNFVERLAAMNIFEFPDTNATERAKSFQINEAGFSAFLSEEARKRGVGYGEQNRQNDAGFLSAVMRLRKGQNTRDFSRCGYVFVTHNGFLAYAARAFLIKERQLIPQQCPPILHLTQVATIAWLLKDQKLSPALAGRELLVNCYAAATPSAAWFATFRAGIEKVVGNSEQFSREPGNAFVLQAARRMAQEQSLANPHIMRQLNVAEILDDARRLIVEQDAARAAEQSERERRESEERSRQEAAVAEAHANELARRESAVRQQAESAAKERLNQRILERSELHADSAVRGLQGLVTASFLVIFLMDALKRFSDESVASIILKVALGAIAALGFLDLVGFGLVRDQFDRIRQWIARKEYNRLSKNFAE